MINEPLPPLSREFWSQQVELNNIFERIENGYPCNKPCNGSLCQSGNYPDYNSINGCIRSNHVQSKKKVPEVRKSIWDKQYKKGQF